jgi:hypothetical protein
MTGEIFKLEPAGMIPIICVSCGAKSFVRPPTGEDDGPIGIAFKEYCKTFKCPECNDFSWTEKI